ncbi:MAG: flavodoxin domain-containing protein [Methanomassiliicoccales archaeon]|nr:flavodoxin domain-containing protein [Methanomassiliicoccales archaeon]
MKVVVVYDSAFGNTEEIAKAIGGAIAGGAEVIRVGEVNPAEMKSIDILVVGSPTNGGRPTPAILDFIDRLSEPAMKGVKVAAFDTRFSTRLVGIFGYAAEKIADGLKAKGAILVLPPEAFYVKSRKGPLKEGELDHAAIWAKEIAE